MVGPTSETPISHLVVPRIFMEQAREDRCRHISADTVVGKRCAVTFSIGVPPLSPSLGIISRLFYSSKDAVERVRPQSNTPAVANLNFCPVVSGGRLMAFSTVP